MLGLQGGSGKDEAGEVGWGQMTQGCESQAKEWFVNTKGGMVTFNWEETQSEQYCR